MTDHAEYDASLGAEYRRWFPPQGEPVMELRCSAGCSAGVSMDCLPPIMAWCSLIDGHDGDHDYVTSGLDEFHPETSHNPGPLCAQHGLACADPKCGAE